MIDLKAMERKGTAGNDDAPSIFLTNEIVTDGSCKERQSYLFFLKVETKIGKCCLWHLKTLSSCRRCRVEKKVRIIRMGIAAGTNTHRGKNEEQLPFRSVRPEVLFFLTTGCLQSVAT